MLDGLTHRSLIREVALYWQILLLEMPGRATRTDRAAQLGAVRMAPTPQELHPIVNRGTLMGTHTQDVTPLQGNHLPRRT